MQIYKQLNTYKINVNMYAALHVGTCLMLLADTEASHVPRIRAGSGPPAGRAVQLLEFRIFHHARRQRPRRRGASRPRCTALNDRRARGADAQPARAAETDMRATRPPAPGLDPTVQREAAAAAYGPAWLRRRASMPASTRTVDGTSPVNGAFGAEASRRPPPPHPSRACPAALAPPGPLSLV